MGLFGNYEDYGSSSRSRLGRGIPRGFRSFMAGPIMRDLVVTSPDVVQLMQEAPLHNATLGVEAIREGKKRGDTGLQVHGQALIALAVQSAERRPVVPGEIRQQVVDVALAYQVDPHENPLIDDVSASRIAGIIDKHS